MRWMWLALMIGCTGPKASDKSVDTDTDTDEPEEAVPGVPLEQAVTLDALLDHLDALEAIARDQGDNRASGLEGYAASADYIEGALIDAGYDVQRDDFEVSSYVIHDASAGLLGDTPWGRGADFEVMTYSGGGSANAELVPVDVMLPPGSANSSTSGCEAADFVGFPSGAIALIQRGSCPFADKVSLAAAAGASAVLIFNEGQQGRTDVVEGYLDEGAISDIPALGLSFSLGESLALSSAGLVAEVMVDASRSVTIESNLIAQTAEGDPDRVVMLGAHLDSVEAGPGINDNGSGSALVLEIATQVATQELHPSAQLRFAFWGAEEVGLVGSERYLYDDQGEPDSALLGKLDAYLNFDMVASGGGSGIRAVYDGDNSDIDDGGATAGSALIEQAFLDWFDAEGLATEAEGLYIPSDAWWFVAEGVPTGGLFSGIDPCYHAACDDTDNLDIDLYDELSAAAASVVQTLALREDPMPRSRRKPTRARPIGGHQHVRWDR